VPQDLQPLVQVGSWVEVPLRNKHYAGIVKKIVPQLPEDLIVKSIITVINDSAIVTKMQLQLWEWIANWYFCTEGEVMQAALPAYFKLSSETLLIFNANAPEDFGYLADDDYLLAEALHIKREINFSEAQKILQKQNIYKNIQQLVEAQICIVQEQMQEKYKPKMESFVYLHPKYAKEADLENLVNNFSKAPKQLELLLAFIFLQQQQTEVLTKELLKKSDSTEAQLKGLVSKNILIVEKKPIDRLHLGQPKINVDVNLSDAQIKAFEAIKQAFSEKETVLLHGITGSGKTLIYIKLIEAYIQKGEQVLFLLPEIALTTQLIRRFQKYFGGYTAVYHSKLNNAERYEQWNKVKEGHIKIIVGARSSLFLPFKNLKCIIVDEEHDTSFKQQDPAPRYHARDSAIYLASLFKAKVLLGSATPSYEMYYQAEQGKFGLVQLNERYSQQALPTIHLIDAKNNVTPNFKGKQFLTDAIKAAITVVLEKKGQIIVFQNRRGYAPYIQCSICGWKPGCTNCSSSLTYHKNKNKLKCHFCSATYSMVFTCANCGSKHLNDKNYGTEKIEEQLAEMFTESVVKRMDVDSVKGKNDYDNLIKQFEDRKIDILVGTQMLVKGLDFDNVQLVIIPDGDSLLHFNDFRVHERAFQLIEQVSGRSGRHYKQGEVLLQMYQTKHPILPFVLTHNYLDLYQKELALRKEFFYPPFSRVLKITLKHKDQRTVFEAAQYFAQQLQQGFSNYISGPEEPNINRINNLYLQEMVLRLPRQQELLKHCRQRIGEIWAALIFQRKYARVVVVVDMDVY
jgi:primosomal protein N' (replication factor Y) (superfamily II helicase)